MKGQKLLILTRKVLAVLYGLNIAGCVLRGLEARKVLLIKATAFKSAQIRAVAEANQ